MPMGPPVTHEALDPWVFWQWPLGPERTVSSLHCPLPWVQFLIVWGRAPLYFLTVPGLRFLTTSSVEQSDSC